MNKELLQQYASLKLQEKAIAEQLAQLNHQVLKEIQDAGVDKVSAEFGTFSIGKRKNWKFSADVQIAEKEVEELKISEKATGKATAEEKPYVIFKNKEE